MLTLDGSYWRRVKAQTNLRASKSSQYLIFFSKVSARSCCAPFISGRQWSNFNRPRTRWCWGQSFYWGKTITQSLISGDQLISVASCELETLFLNRTPASSQLSDEKLKHNKAFIVKNLSRSWWGDKHFSKILKVWWTFYFPSVSLTSVLPASRSPATTHRASSRCDSGGNPLELFDDALSLSPRRPRCSSEPSAWRGHRVRG